MVTAARHSAKRRLIMLFILALVICLTVILRQPTRGETALVAPVEASSEQAVINWQRRLEQNPEDAQALAQLGLAYLQQVRQTADAQLYVLAEQALTEALAQDDEEVDALMGQGILALARHDFQAAIEWGQKAKNLNPFRAQILGILVDGYTELGRYQEAVNAAQAMVDLRPDLPAYSRISYLRELHGDVDGAIRAMETAVSFGLPGGEEWAWAQVQLGNLYLNHGQVDRAEAIYEETLHYRPHYAYALAGLAKAAAARGDYEAAIRQLQPLVERLPLPEFAIALADLYAVTDQPEAAQQQYDLVRLIQRLNEEAGMVVDLELALFEADHGVPTVAAQKARLAYGHRPSLVAADVLAWALYQDGAYEEAWTYMQKALRLGTQDALMYYHAGKIAYALGDAELGQNYLEKALAINPAFSIRYAAEAQAILARYPSNLSSELPKPDRF